MVHKDLLIHREISRTKAHLKILEQYGEFLNALQGQNMDEAHWEKQLKEMERQQKELNANTSEDSRDE